MQKRIAKLSCPIIFLSLPSCVLPPQSATYAELLARITVETGKHTRIETPVSVSLEEMDPDVVRAGLKLVEIRDSRRVAIPSQIEPSTPAKIWWVLDRTTPAGSERVYELEPGSSGDGAPSDIAVVQVVKNDSFLELQRQNAEGNNKVLRYNHAVVPAPEDMGRVPEERRPLYDRSGFIHPLWSPSGAVLTDIHPLDHIHHMGIWMPWTHTRYEGNLVDFWNVGDGTGTVRFTKYLSTTEGLVYSGFQAEHEHVARKTSEGEKVILKETWDVRVYNTGWPEKEYWLIDFKSTQRCVADKPLLQEQYRYGGFGFRGAREWKGENAAYLTSEGKTRADGHAARARWCDTSGKIEKWQGVTFYSHPNNFQHPEPMRIWPEFENNVFFNFCPSQAGEWEMKPSEDHVFRYRLYVHEGKVNVDDAERIWHDYAEPPTVKLEVVNRQNP